MKYEAVLKKIILFIFIGLLISQIFILSNLNATSEELYTVLGNFNKLLLILFITIGFIKDKNINEWIFMLVALGVSILIYFRSYSLIPIQLFIFVFVFKNMNPIPIVKYFIVFSLFSVSLIVILNLIGIIPSTIIIRPITNITRNSLGFIHPNTLANILFSINCGITILYFNKIRWYHYFVLALSILVSVFVLDSRTSTIIFILQIAVIYLCKSFSKYANFIITIINIMTFIFINLFSLVMMFIYQDSIAFHNRLNKLFSGRLFFLSIYFKRYGIKLFGSFLEFGESLANEYALTFSYFGIDNSYGRMIINFGVIFYILFLSLYLYASIRFYETKSIGLSITLFLSSLLLFSENFLINNPVLFLPFILCLSKLEVFDESTELLSNSETVV